MPGTKMRAGMSLKKTYRHVSMGWNGRNHSLIGFHGRFGLFVNFHGAKHGLETF
jgi:hypothetical protein